MARLVSLDKLRARVAQAQQQKARQQQAMARKELEAKTSNATLRLAEQVAIAEMVEQTWGITKPEELEALIKTLNVKAE